MHFLACLLLLLKTEISLFLPASYPVSLHVTVIVSLLPLFGLPAAAYPAAYGQISQAFPQPPPMIPQQQREGESASRAPRPLPIPFSPHRGHSPGSLAGYFIGKMTMFLRCPEGERRRQDCEMLYSPIQTQRRNSRGHPCKPHWWEVKKVGPWMTWGSIILPSPVERKG